jgi:hypothetical protein
MTVFVLDNLAIAQLTVSMNPDQFVQADFRVNDRYLSIDLYEYEGANREERRARKFARRTNKTWDKG